MRGGGLQLAACLPRFKSAPLWPILRLACRDLAAGSRERSPRVDRPAAGASRKQNEQPAGDCQILLEMQQLVAIAQLGVEQHSSRRAEAREQQRGRARV